jgi:hypothetical protein
LIVNFYEIFLNELQNTLLDASYFLEIRHLIPGLDDSTPSSESWISRDFRRFVGCTDPLA